MAERNPRDGESSDAREIPQTSDRPGPSGFIPASPPQFISMDELMKASNLVNNMMLAHEIAVDENFKLEKAEPPEGSLEKIVSDTMHRAFWDSLSEKINSNPPDHSQTVALIEEIKDKLLRCLLPQHNRIREVVNEVLDIDLIRQKIDNDAFDILYYAQFVQNLMSKLCAPVRDEDIAKLSDITEIIPLFKEIFRILDIMILDMANQQVQQIRPYLQQQSITYERTKFEELLSKQQVSGVDGLEYTRQWLERSYEILEESSGDTPIFGSNLTKVTLTPANVINGAFIELLDWADNIFPESCLMDQQKFFDIAFELRKLTLVSSVLVVIFNSVGEKLGNHNELKERLKADILAILSDIPESQYKEKILNVAEHVVTEVGKELENCGYESFDQSTQALIRDRVTTVVSREHTVHALLWRRLMTFLFQSLSHSSNNAIQLPQGLGTVRSELYIYCGKFLRLCAHNKAVFGHWYADIIGTLMETVDFSPRQPAARQASAVN